MSIPDCLLPYVAAKVIDDTDAAAAALLVDVARREAAGRGRQCDPSTAAWLGMCLALRTPRDGHTCVDLGDSRSWAGEIDFDHPAHPPWPDTADDWIAELATAGPLVSLPGGRDGEHRTPFVVEGSRLYLARSLAEEDAIAQVIRGTTGVSVRILLGGPGTGKTTTVAADLARRFAEPGPQPRLALAAPTAKAAARMTDVLKERCGNEKALADLGVTVAPGVREALLAAVEAAPATTVHKLLGASPRGRKLFAFDARTPLPYDLVIVDECSMLDSSLMSHLLAALARGAEIRLVGDPDQLVSVEAGSVLADIRAVADASNWEATGRSRTLTVQRRFKNAPDIGRLADAIRTGNAAEAIEVLGSSARGPVHWVRSGRKQDIDRVVGMVATQALALCTAAEKVEADILERKERMQVLCANREGPMGVSGWNRRIESRLGSAARAVWYPGRPVMVTRNNRALGLANGDVGVVVPAAEGRREVVFGSDERPHRVPVTRLENITTVHALTIHKSQGSEYDHVVVVLPEKKSPLLTRQLLYTAVTRAREEVTVIGSEEVIRAAIGTLIRRATGLATRLEGG